MKINEAVRLFPILAPSLSAINPEGKTKIIAGIKITLIDRLASVLVTKKKSANLPSIGDRFITAKMNEK